MISYTMNEIRKMRAAVIEGMLDLSSMDFLMAQICAGLSCEPVLPRVHAAAMKLAEEGVAK